MKDLIGKALLDYQKTKIPECLITETNVSEPEKMPVSYFFRSFKKMSPLEQKALKLARGKVLDVGCGAGSHALYLQNELKLDVTAIDVSEKAIKTCLLRGVKNAKQQDIMTFKNQTFDTILLLMNGTGICGSLNKFSEFLMVLKSLLNPGGKIILDSSDIKYLFENTEAEFQLKNTSKYYGEITFNVTYKNEKEKDFLWLYLDFNKLKEEASKCKLQCNLIFEGKNFDYLACIF